MNSRKPAFFSMFLPICLALTLTVAGQTKPEITGTWKMNAEKSKFERGGPQGITIKLAQQGATLSETMTLTTPDGDRAINLTYSLDGREGQQQLDGRPIKTTARWEAETLIVEFKNEEGFSFLRKISLSSDGKTMTIAVKQTTANRVTQDTLVLERQ